MANPNFFHRVFLGWLSSEISSGRVSKSRKIADMAPIDLNKNNDLFSKFLDEENLNEHWQQLEREQGKIDVLTYFNG